MSFEALTIYLDPPGNALYGDELFAPGANPYSGDDLLAPFRAIKDHFESLRVPVHTADLLPPDEGPGRKLLISFGTPDRLPEFATRRYRRLAQRSDVKLSAFFAMECPVVEPRMYRQLPALSKLFSRTFSWSDQDALLPFTGRPVELQHFYWPQSYDAVQEEIWLRRDRRFLLMMNTNKLPRLYVDELYTERLRAVEYFQEFGEVDLFGRYWDKPPIRVGKTLTPWSVRRSVDRLRAYWDRLAPDAQLSAIRSAWKGVAESKSDTISQYRFALCFENSVLKGWITEKLFDCFFAGTVPIYWGAPEVGDLVPEECFIDMRRFADYDQLRAFLHGLSDRDVDAYRMAARRYLDSDAFDPFRISSWIQRIDRVVREDIEEPW